MRPVNIEEKDGEVIIHGSRSQLEALGHACLLKAKMGMNLQITLLGDKRQQDGRLLDPGTPIKILCTSQE